MQKIKRHPDFDENASFYYDYRHDPFTPPLRVVSAGNAIWSGNHEYIRTNSEMFGIEMITHGNSLFVQDGKEYLVSAGEVYFLRRGCRHTYKVGPAGYLHKRYCVLEGGGLEPLLHSMNLFECDYVHLLSPVVVSHVFRRMNKVMREKLSGFTVELSIIAYHLLLELGRSLTVQYPEPIRAAVEFMQQNLTQPLDCETIRMHSGLSMTHFNRLFSQYTGVSPVQFLMSQRMSLARHLLLQTSLSVKQVASAVGFDDALYFSARFKRYIGISPQHFRAGVGK